MIVDWGSRDHSRLRGEANGVILALTPCLLVSVLKTFVGGGSCGGSRWKYSEGGCHKSDDSHIPAGKVCISAFVD